MLIGQRRSRRCALPIVAGVALSLGCVAQPEDTTPVNDALIVSTEWLSEHVDDPSVVVLHVARGREHYDKGHIPGAHFLDFNTIVHHPDGLPNELPPVAHLDSVFEAAGVSDDTRIVLYGGWGGLAAGRAFFTLDYLGHGDHTALLDGGIEVWRRQDRPLSSDEPEVAPGILTPAPRPEVVARADWIREHLADTAVRLLDARPVQNYSGRSPGTDIARAGHIPGAASVYWQTAIKGPHTPALRSSAEIAALFREAGAEGKQVVTYCRTGMQASYLYFVARYLGYQPMMYDGSYYEWSANADLPVEVSDAAP